MNSVERGPLAFEFFEKQEFGKKFSYLIIWIPGVGLEKQELSAGFQELFDIK